MPECPHCGGYYFGNPDQCPKCYYHFKEKRVLKPEDIVIREQRERERKEEQHKQEMERAKQERDARALALLSSAQYEYTTVYLADSCSGMLDKNALDTTLQQHAAQGWRLHSVFTNEAGKNASSVGFGGVTAGTNSTMDITILIFERCIKLAGQ